jgi:hypothetical protein
MNLAEMRSEIKDLGKKPTTERMFPITSDWVPVTDVLAIIGRFEKYWRRDRPKRSESEDKLVAEILGQK